MVLILSDTIIPTIIHRLLILKKRYFLDLYFNIKRSCALRTLLIIDTLLFAMRCLHLSMEITSYLALLLQINSTTHIISLSAMVERLAFCVFSSEAAARSVKDLSFETYALYSTATTLLSQLLKPNFLWLMTSLQYTQLILT